jgi:hypothetical protein
MAFRPIVAASSITGVIATGGLTGGGTSGNVTLAIADGGVTANKIAPHQVVTSVNGLTDGVLLSAGPNISITTGAPNTLTIAATGSGSGGPPTGPAGGALSGDYPNPGIAPGQVVRAIKTSTAVLTDTVALLPGSGVTFDTSGNAITINSHAGEVIHDSTLQGTGLIGSPLGAAVPLTLTNQSTTVLLSGVVNSATCGVSSQGAAYGVYTTGETGIHAEGNSYAGYFVGSVRVNGTLSKSAGSFRIDHPLDPENKYLCHSFVESPDMMNIYNGNVTLDARGEATIEMPDWFSALNRDFRYQLTAIGAPSPNVYVAEEINDNRFRIAGGAPGGKISWQVTGIRHDRYADAHRIPVEEEKPANERGLFIHPDLWGQPPERGIDAVHRR